MKPFRIAAFAVLACLAPLAQAVSLGQCASADTITRKLASEGQRVVVKAHASAAKSPPQVWIARSKVDGSGYLLRQDGRRGMCVAAALKEVRIGQPGGSAKSDKRLLERSCARTAHNTRANARLCASLKKAGVAITAIDVDTFVDSGPAPGQWRAAQFGFCKAGENRLVLCLSTTTRG
jgi:hypothetical protein